MGPRPTIIPKVIPEKKHRTRPVGTIDVKARRVSGSGTVAGGLVLADNAIGTRAIDTMTDATAKRVKLLLFLHSWNWKRLLLRGLRVKFCSLILKVSKRLGKNHNGIKINK